MPSGFGGGLDCGKDYAKYIVQLLVGGFVLWFLYEGLNLINTFQQ